MRRYSNYLIRLRYYERTKNHRTDNLPDFNESVEIDVYTNLAYKINDMAKHGLPNDIFVNRNPEPEHGGLEVSYRAALLPVMFQVKIPNRSRNTKCINFLTRLFSEFIHSILQVLYMTPYGLPVQHMYYHRNPESTISPIGTGYVVSCAFMLPVSELIIQGTNIVITEVNMHGLVSIMDSNASALDQMLLNSEVDE